MNVGASVAGRKLYYIEVRRLALDCLLRPVKSVCHSHAAYVHPVVGICGAGLLFGNHRVKDLVSALKVNNKALKARLVVVVVNGFRHLGFD